MFRRLIQALAAGPVLIACVALFALMFLTFADVALRSAVNAPIEAATELTRIAVALVVFSALPLLSARGGHIVVDLLDPLLKRLKLFRFLEGGMSIACGVLLYFPARRAVDLAERARAYGDATEYLGLPDFYLAWFIALSAFVAAAAMVARGVIELVAPALMEARP